MGTNVIPLSKRRRLVDLYIRGQEVSLNDDSDEDPIVVWISKISPLENKDAADRAASARAVILSAKYNHDDEDRYRYVDQLSEFGDRETKIKFLAQPKLQESQMKHEAELSSEDKWSKDNYYNSLIEAWTSGLMERYDENPKDPEAKKVYTELMKFAKEVEKRLDTDSVNILSDYDIKSDKEIDDEVIDRLIETDADFAWLAEFRKWQLFYAVREPTSHKDRYFLAKEEVDALDPRILSELLRVFTDLSVEPMEGKDSEETPSS